MKLLSKYKSVLIISFLFLSLAAFADELPRISVTGTAVTLVKPDLIIWNIRVENEEKELNQVAEKHTKIVENILAFLKTKNINKNNIQTSSMKFGVKTKYIDNTQVKDGYFASTDISFELRQLDQYNGIWTGLANIDNVEIINISYDTSKRIDIKNETRIKALLAAQSKAKALAEAVDAKIGEPILIEDTSQQWSPSTANNIQFSRAEVSDRSGNIAVGELRIEMEVRAEFKLITKLK